MLALEGIKVLDLSNYVPGALCTMILADFGAEVIKVEPAKAFPMGDMGYSPGGKDKEREAAFFALNRNKKCIGLNLRSDEGRRIFHRMAKEADVVIEGYRPGVVERLGVDYKTIQGINPRIIYCSLVGLRPGRALQALFRSRHQLHLVGGGSGAHRPERGPPIHPAQHHRRLRRRVPLRDDRDPSCARGEEQDGERPVHRPHLHGGGAPPDHLVYAPLLHGRHRHEARRVLGAGGLSALRRLRDERREMAEHRVPGAALLGQSLQGHRERGIHAVQVDHGDDLPGARVQIRRDTGRPGKGLPHENAE